MADIEMIAVSGKEADNPNSSVPLIADRHRIAGVIIMADPFPPPYENLLADDSYLGAALERARLETIAAFPGHQLPAISLVAIKQTGTTFEFPHAGLQFGDMFFSGSLPKIAAMYAAFELYRAINFLPEARNSTTGPQAYAKAKNAFDGTINTGAPLISAARDVTSKMRVPTYESIFASLPDGEGGRAFEFNLNFSTNMRNMIVKSDNAAAGACVKSLGYSWINGALERGGFFYSPSKTGLWLAGTYVGGWPAVRVPCLNDRDTAQGTTCFDAANMYAHLIQGTLGRPVSNSSEKMLGLLESAAAFDASFIDWTRRGGDGVSPKRYRVTHTKIGIGPRAPRPSVLSEATILTHSDTGRMFIVVLQNILSGVTPLNLAATLVDLAIDHYVNPPP